MKRFDKRYVYCSFVGDLFGSFLVLIAFLGEFISEYESFIAGIKAIFPIFAIGFLLIYSCFVGYRIAFYRTSGYELTENEIKCTRGVLFRKRSVLEYRKIHAVNKKQSIFQRIFGIAVLTVDSGSTNTSHQAEITIVERSGTVDAMIEKLNLLRDGISVDSEGEEIKESVLLSKDDKLYSFTSKKKMAYTLFNLASMALGTAIFAVIAIFAISVCKLTVASDLFGTWGQYFFGATAITVGLMLVLEIFIFIGAVVHSFIGYYGFNIRKLGNDIEISYGLINKQTNTFSLERIKAVKISQGLLQRLFGFATIQLEVIGYINESGNDNGQLGVLVPFCKYSEIDEILGRILPDFIPEKKETCAVAFFPFVSWFLLIYCGIVGIALAIILAILAICHAPTIAMLITAICVMGLSLLVIGIRVIDAYLAYRNNGIALDGERITAYCGGFNRRITVFKAKNLISVEDVTTPLRKRAGITSLVMHLKTNAASNEIKVHIQEDVVVAQLEELLTL